MQRFRPCNFMLLPTMSCQASCRYCFARKSGEAMSGAVVRKALDFIDRLAPEDRDFHVTFHGGEPLLAGEGFYQSILPMFAERFGRRIHLSIQSNLWTMTDSLAELFRKYRVSVGASLDGYEEMCDTQRGAGYYARTTVAAELLRRHQMEAGYICTFAAPNADRAGEVFRRSEYPYSIHGAVPVLRAPDTGMSVSAEQMTRILLDSYRAYQANPAHNRITTIDAMAKGCLEGEGKVCTFFDCLGSFAAIAPDGGVYSCQRFCGFADYCLGNVMEDLTEEQILSSAAFRRLREVEDGKQSACGDCAHTTYCGGGCLYNALAIGEEKDPYCEAYRAVFNCITRDMALEMGGVMLGRATETPVLAMAGNQPHPYDRRQNAKALRLALEKGRSGESFAAERLRNPYPENDLNKLYLHVTFDCPLRCSHCYAEGGTRKSAVLQPARLAEIVREAADARFRSVVITGGEPLVYAGFDEFCVLLSEMNRKGTKLILRSSFGFDMPDRRMDTICALFDEIVVSVDGDQESHDARRGAGRYARTIRNLEKTVEIGAAKKIALAATMTRVQSEGRPGEAVRALAERLNISNVRFRPVLPIGRAVDTDAERWNFCSEEVDPAQPFRPRSSCGLGQNLYVEPDGGAYPCYAWCTPEAKLGDLGKESLAALLDRGELYEYCRHDVDSNEKCRSCEVRYLCGGICKAWARDRHNVDSGDFDCAARQSYFSHLVEWIEKDAFALVSL